MRRKRDRNDARDVSEACGCSCWCGRPSALGVGWNGRAQHVRRRCDEETKHVVGGGRTDLEGTDVGTCDGRRVKKRRSRRIHHPVHGTGRRFHLHPHVAEFLAHAQSHRGTTSFRPTPSRSCSLHRVRSTHDEAHERRRHHRRRRSRSFPQCPKTRRVQESFFSDGFPWRVSSRRG